MRFSSIDYKNKTHTQTDTHHITKYQHFRTSLVLKGRIRENRFEAEYLKGMKLAYPNSRSVSRLTLMKFGSFL